MKLRLYLHILQLEGYNVGRFLRWVWEHPFPKELEGKKPLVWTSKAKFLYRFAAVLLPVTLFSPWVSLVLGLLVLKPYEYLNRWRVKWQVRQKIRRLKKTGLKVIGITGSYGKTSTKEFLYQILKTKYRVLRTPESYNTVFGIAKVVEKELSENYDVFICEMGAYKRGEIAELCWMVEPDYGILTGINVQHLERFGGIENTIKAKFELVDYVGAKRAVVNAGNDLVRQNMPEGVITYGMGKYKHPSEQNSEGAAKMAKILGVNKIPDFKLPPHRLTLIKRGEMTIIDDAYSSNVDGFVAAMKYLATFPGWKVVVTPGIAELGAWTLEVHKDLGKLMRVADQVILVGRNDRTKGLEMGYGKPVEYVDRVGEAMGGVKKPKAVVLFENDLPDNY